jgi:hypothetical protein
LQIKDRNIRFVERRPTDCCFYIIGRDDVVFVGQGPIELLRDCFVIIDDQILGLWWISLTAGGEKLQPYLRRRFRIGDKRE